MTWGAGSDPGAAESRAILLQIGATTFAILALELALIRWTSGQIRSFAYFNNLVLIGAFLGMGLGVALGERRAGWVRLALPALALLAVPLAFSESLGLVHLAFTDPSVFQWGAERRAAGPGAFARNLIVFLALFALLVTVFALAGSAVGRLFSRVTVSRAYAADLTGSLLGILCFTGATFFNSSPPIWIALGGLPLAWVAVCATPRGRSRARAWIVQLGALALAVLLARHSVGEALYSPYNRIDIERRGTSLRLSVNRDFHQYMHPLADVDLAALSDPAERERLSSFRRAYDLPFTINPRRGRALVVGAGTGNDVQAALRQGYDEVVSVEIDGRILELGSELHPERPYADPRVRPVVDDARAFFQRYRGPPFDAVVYGLLDSHAMFSSMSTLRLDNYVYTEEGFRAAWDHVAEDGHLAVSFSVFAGDWIADRLYRTLEKATGITPIANFHGMHFGASFVVPKPRARLDPGPLAGLRPIRPNDPGGRVRTTSDDWPFLYVKPGVFPWGYAVVLGLVVAGTAVAMPLAFGPRRFRGSFDLPLFAAGAAFLLIETRGVTSLALLFGSTWIVNSAVFATVLAVVIAGNACVRRFRLADTRPWFVMLFTSLILLWFLDLDLLNGLPMWLRGTVGGGIHALPIAFAGVIVPILLSRSADPTGALGSNLLGAVLGGSLEYLGMWTGLRALIVLAGALYLVAAVGVRSRSRRVATRRSECDGSPSREYAGDEIANTGGS